MRKIICSAAIIALLIAVPMTSAIMTGTTKMSTQADKIDGELGGLEMDFSNPVDAIKSLNNIEDIDVKLTENEEINLWKNEEARGFFGVATITGQLLELEAKPLSSRDGPDDFGFYIKWYKVTGRNAFGWPMFWLSARGIFLFNGQPLFIFPYSYTGVDWWCGWAWSGKLTDQIATKGTNWGKVYAEGRFTHDMTNQKVNLWAYVKCFGNGNAVGDGGGL
jgi:hypothetical protein